MNEEPFEQSLMFALKVIGLYDSQGIQYQLPSILVLTTSTFRILRVEKFSACNDSSTHRKDSAPRFMDGSEFLNSQSILAGSKKSTADGSQLRSRPNSINSNSEPVIHDPSRSPKHTKLLHHQPLPAPSCLQTVVTDRKPQPPHVDPSRAHFRAPSNSLHGLISFERIPVKIIKRPGYLKAVIIA